MHYIDFEFLERFDPKVFQNQEPYPWWNPQGVLTVEGYQRLLETLPEVSMFEKKFGVERSHGQYSHDRYALEYQENLQLPDPWKAFIAELQGDRYRKFLCRLFGVRSVFLNFHWHYTPNGCSVSPHCDARRKLGSHIFYFNTEQDWDPSWGGETLILDDGGRFHRKSAPAFEDFDHATPSVSLGNRSLLFGRSGNSWHGVREIHCPEGRLRKVFIVVVNSDNLVARLRRRFRRAA
jgi:hypothetical protein